jgi:diadenosine tetraphosphatase ApaH/serine/threonine PP2A family protein phosphatase
MKLAILADVHANLEALNACLAHASRQGANRHVFLGDLVGYGADPQACLEIVRRHAADGAIVVRGNHDDAALGGLQADMHPEAREAIIWTRAQLSDEDRNFLTTLPYVIEEDDNCFVHASADHPGEWTYLAGKKAAAQCLAATHAARVFAGHVHEPALYFSSREGVSAHLPGTGSRVPLSPSRRWLALVGSVGQPRDGNPAASYAILDCRQRQLCFHRVAYDWISAAAKIRAAGLPQRLAARLEHGL